MILVRNKLEREKMQNINIKYVDIEGIKKENGVYYISKQCNEYYLRVIEKCHETIKDGHYSHLEIQKLIFNYMDKTIRKIEKRIEKENAKRGYCDFELPKYKLVITDV